MQRGWIKVWRKLQDDEIWMNPEPFNKRDAWIDLLLMTWTKDKTFIIGNRAVKLEPGQIFLSYRFLCSKWHWSTEKLKTYLELLASKDVKKITYKSTKDGTLISILNWETYQPIFDVDQTPTDTTSERKPNANRTITEQNKEVKKVKEVKNKSSTVGGSDSRIARLLKFFGIVFRDTFGVDYKANFGADGKIIKDQLRYADKSYPKGRAEIALAITMDTWLEKQKEMGMFKKTTIPGWLKDFNSTNIDIDWDTTNWEEMEREYEDVQKKIKSQK